MNIGEYLDFDGVALAAHIKKGSVSQREALDLAYQVIDQFDSLVNAFVSLEKEDAYALAGSSASGDLQGVPIAMKDCVGFVKGAPRSFGSRLSVETRINFDEEVVRRFRRAGLIPIGTTNVPEFSSSMTTESILHGPCRNPWNMKKSVGGSSGGSAAAVAYGAVPIAYGNDAAGSIRIPASCCGVFGFRPSRGRVPTGPVHGEIWFGLMVHHVITRSVRDSALVLDVSEGIDNGAPYGAPDKDRAYLEECSRDPGCLRIAVSDGSDQGHVINGKCMAALQDTASLLEDLGHQVDSISPNYNGVELTENITTIMCVSLAEELPAIAKQNGRTIGPDTVESVHLDMMSRGQQISAVELSRVLTYRTKLGRMMGEFFTDYDVLLTPTLAEPPLALGTLNTNSNDTDEYLDRLWRYTPFTPLANVCGLPSMSVPLCWTDGGLPIGMMVTGRYAEEGLLFRLAGQLEAARPWRDRHPPVSAWYRQAQTPI